MHIRKTQPQEIPRLLEIYDHAKKFMREHGNPNQWNGAYPQPELLEQDITEGNSYVCEEDGEILGTFYFRQGIDPTYVTIYQGQWRNDAPYGVTHRICVAAHQRGVASFCLNWCFEQCGNLKIDTHRDNTVMQNLLQKNGFVYCGIIHLANGAERLAYQKG